MKATPHPPRSATRPTDRARREQPRSLAERVLELLARRDAVPLGVPELLRRLGLGARQEAELRRALAELERAGRVAPVKGERWFPSLAADLVPGRLRLNRAGKGFLLPDDPGLEEIVVPADATGTAFHEDRVLVRRDVPLSGLRRDASPPNTGSVHTVLERRRTRFVGTLERGPRFLRVVPDDPRIPHGITVPEPRPGARRARAGDKVVVELREWTDPRVSPDGDVVEVLGAPTTPGVDRLSVLRQYGLEPEFPREVVREARAFGAEVRARDLAGRADRRAERVITIDPDDARDFDDAFSLERVAGGEWRLRVHVADVSHYVKAGSALDAEACRRGNSTYLVDRVIPMLPEELSNALCSLVPGADRLTKCVELLIDREGHVRKTHFHSAVIRSQRRFTYREAFAVIQARASGPVETMLHDAHALAQRLRARRFRAGALELDTPETKIRLDERGAVARIERVENDASHQLIEEFMLLANEAAAARLVQQRRAALHRVHEEPDPRRLQEFREDVLAHRVPCGDLAQRAEVQKLLARLAKLPIGPALRIGFLRSLARARYSVESLGHYGLAKRHYTHFTSPIRRYADLEVHRALFEPVGRERLELAKTAEHVSATERNSSDAERDSKDGKLLAFLEKELRSETPPARAALVTDVRNFGFFVDVPELGMSGVVPLSSLADDFYELERQRGRLVGRRTRRTFSLGDRVEVRVLRVDRAKRQADFRLADAPASGAKAAKHAGQRARTSSRRRKSRRASTAAGASPATRASTRR